MKKCIVVAATLLLTQGCAAAAALTKGVITDASQTRPGVVDGFNRGQRDPVAGGFGMGRPSLPAPGNIPLPVEANPWRRFATPGLSPNAANLILGGVTNVVLVGCALDEVNGNSSDQCMGRADRIIVAGPSRKPIIHR